MAMASVCYCGHPGMVPTTVKWKLGLVHIIDSNGDPARRHLTTQPFTMVGTHIPLRFQLHLYPQGSRRISGRGILFLRLMGVEGMVTGHARAVVSIPHRNLKWESDMQKVLLNRRNSYEMVLPLGLRPEDLICSNSGPTMEGILKIRLDGCFHLNFYSDDAEISEDDKDNDTYTLNNGRETTMV